MRYGTGFRNCNDVTAADGPGQRNSGCRATVCCANTCKRGITQQAGGGAAQWRIGHHRHAVLLAPWQQVMFNDAVADIVRHLICRAAIALWNTEQVFQVADLEVGHAPGANLPCRAQIFKSCHDAGKVGDAIWPVQQIEIEIISAETSEARLTSARDAVSRHVAGPHLRYQEYAIALTSDHAADEFLGAVHFRRVDQRHPERKACAQRFFFISLRMSSLSETRRALAQCWDNSAVAKLHRPSCSIKGRCGRRSQKRTQRHAKSIEFTPVQQPRIFTIHYAIRSAAPIVLGREDGSSTVEVFWTTQPLRCLFCFFSNCSATAKADDLLRCYAWAFRGYRSPF